MPVSLGEPQDMSEEEFNELRRAKRQRSGNAMIEEVLDRVEAGRPQRVPLPEGQNAKGARIALKRAATTRGLAIETVEGDGYIAVSPVEASPPRKSRQMAGEDGQRRRGRPPKQQLKPDDIDASLQDIATGEG